jgi:hypothetical protein
MRRLFAEAVSTAGTGATATILIAAVTALTALALAAVTAAGAAVAIVVAEIALVAAIAVAVAAGSRAAPIVALTASALARAFALARGAALATLHLALIGAALIVLLALGTIDFAITIVPDAVALSQTELDPGQGQERRHASRQTLEGRATVGNIRDRACPGVKPAIVQIDLPRYDFNTPRGFAGEQENPLSSVQRDINTLFCQVVNLSSADSRIDITQDRRRSSRRSSWFKHRPLATGLNRTRQRPSV